MNDSALSVEGNRILLLQGVTMLERLSDLQYGNSTGTRAPVGAQYRHVAEHYVSFLKGVRSGRVDYDARARDEEIERSRSAALSATKECLDGLAALSGQQERRLEVQMDSGLGPQAPDWRESSAGRELQFLCSHTVHHYALIRLLLEGVGVEMEKGFGVAPSTLSFQRAAVR